MKLVIDSKMQNALDGDCAIQKPLFVPGMSCGIDLSQALIIEPELESDQESQPSVEFGQPLQDWFELALKAETPRLAANKNTWGEDEEDVEDEVPGAGTEEDEQDPFDDFDEDDFDDDFDDDFEEELDDEYEIEPADDGLVPGVVEDTQDEILDEDEEIDPGLDDL